VRITAQLIEARAVLEAYALYLQARHLGRQFTAETLRLSSALYRQALAIDTDYAAAWDGLANNYIGQASDGLLPADDAFAEAHAALARALAADPDYALAHSDLGYLFLADGRWDEAIATYQSALQLSPDYLGAYFHMGVAQLLKGEAAAALASMQQEKYEVYRLLGLVMAYHAMADTAASDAALVELIENFEREWAYNIAFVLAYRDEPDKAFEWLEKAVTCKDTGLAEIVRQPLFINISDDPRWLPFLESIGKSPAQLDAIGFRVTLPR
jgi:tetratricopeptide (TPR) repeat protein